jgi:bleomycin hydrolase
MKKNLLLLFFVLSYSIIFAQPLNFKLLKNIKTTPVKDQARAGTCWAFSTVSFIETEILRTTEKEFDLSESYIVYYTYIDKAKMYVRLHGFTSFSQGGQAHDVLNVMKKHGIMPEKDYPYSNKNHTTLENRTKTYLDSIVKMDTIPANWLDGFVFILNYELGIPPDFFVIDNVKYTPTTYMTDVLKFNPNDYVEFTSYNHHPFNSQFALEIPDNWSRNLYFNITIEELISLSNYSLNNGFSFVWDGDVSETAFENYTGIVEFETKNHNKFQVASAQPQRQQMFENQTTSDDHLMHITGLFSESNKNYYKVKNSWGLFPPYNGFLYMSEDFYKYKTVAILVNINAIPQNLKLKLKIN